MLFWSPVMTPPFIRSISTFLVSSSSRFSRLPICGGDVAKRTLLSAAHEPPLHVTERPCTLVLLEDENIYRNSLGPSLHEIFPDDYGMATRTLTLDNDDAGGDLSTSWDAALQRISNDLQSSSDPAMVLLARGPCASWLAQFYLESMPLAGLILVDPVPWDDTRGARQMEAYYKQQTETKTVMSSPSPSSDYYGQLFQDYSENWNHWTLKLEPGVVPMMVWRTRLDWELAWACDSVADYHSKDDDIISVVELPYDDPQHVQKVAKVAASWIMDRVL